MHGSEHTAWKRATEIAAGQHGCATFAQLRKCDLSPEQLEWAVIRGRLFRPHERIYSFGHMPVTPKERAMAAVLSCGRWALTSHLWCLYLFDLKAHVPAGLVDITTRNLSGRPDVKLHRTLCAASSGRKTTTLKALVPLDQRGATRSILEDMLFDKARAETWDTPEINATVEGIECDFVFPRQRRIIQAEGWYVHGTHIAFENDREIQLTLQAAGWEITPVTYRMVTTDWATTRRKLDRLLAR